MCSWSRSLGFGWRGLRRDSGGRGRTAAQVRSNDSPTVASVVGGDFELFSITTQIDAETYDALLFGRDTEGRDMTDQPSAAGSLDAIRNGAGNMLVTIRQRINEAVTAFDEGDFALGQQRLDEARACAQPLANAQTYLAVADTGRIVRARDLEAGMMMTKIGEITEVVKGECDHESCPGHFLIHVGGHEPILLDGDTTIYVDVQNG